MNIGTAPVKYYMYCPKCGHQKTISYPTGIGAIPIDRVVPAPINGSPISYVSECPGCKGKNCGITTMAEDSIEMKVFLRSAIHYHIDSPAIQK